MDRAERLLWVLVGMFLAAGGVALLIIVMPAWLAELLGGLVLLSLGLLALRAGWVR